MTQNELAEALGISKGQCSKLAARGMPTDSLEAAQAWRCSTLDPAWAKPTRAPARSAVECNPIDAVVVGILPRLLFEPDRIEIAARAAEIEIDGTAALRLATTLAAVYAATLREIGFEDFALNLPPGIGSI